MCVHKVGRRKENKQCGGGDRKRNSKDLLLLFLSELNFPKRMYES